MNPALFVAMKLRFRTELTVVGLTLVVVLGIPVAAMASMTNLPSLAKDDSLKLYTGTGSKDNLYDFGYCTFWTSKRRQEVGFPIPQNWGNANTWNDNAVRSGYRVDHLPAVHAIMQTDEGPLGHVAFVESVTPGGGWTVSEMNVAGWDILSDRTFKPSQAKVYNFIH